MLSGSGIVTTVAGDETQNAAVDGLLARASALFEPTSVAVDADGNMYIADSLHNRIRLVTKSTGFMTTVAGKGTAGDSGDGQAATQAELNVPRTVIIGASGNLYIADTDNHRIRMVKNGIITTVAGTGVLGFNQDAQLATKAQLASPNGVAVDAEGNIYIADTYNHRIRMVSGNTGMISTVAGDGYSGFSENGVPAINSGLTYPFAIAVDASGNIFIADTLDHMIRKVTKSTGFISTLVGTGAASYTGDNGDGQSATLYYPTSIALDAGGNIFICDFVNNVIRYWTKDTGIVTTVAGGGTSTADGNPARDFQFRGPVGISADPSGTLYISDTNNNVIRKFEPRFAPTSSPTATPTLVPSAGPSQEPTELPTELPTMKPSKSPTLPPSRRPSETPKNIPRSRYPTHQPSCFPSEVPVYEPTEMPVSTRRPTKIPSRAPTAEPSVRQSSNSFTLGPSASVPTDASPQDGSPTMKPIKAKCPCRNGRKPTHIPTAAPPTKRPTVKRPSRKTTRRPSA